jgi:hypothetical protein
MSLVERRDDKSDFLARRGGWMLVIWGVVLVILACVFASSTAVASIFAFTGAASVVLGILAARFEGDFELSATGLKGKLIAVAVREDLTLEDKGDEMVRIVERTAHVQLESTASSQPPWSGPSGAMSRGLAFEQAAMDWLRSTGWQIDPPGNNGRGLGDFIAKKDGEILLVEVKYRSRLSVADVRHVQDMAAEVASIDQTPGLRFVLAVPAGSLSRSARHAATKDSAVPLKILEIPEPSAFPRDQ